MFTLEQLKAAHRKVKSGADFPAYIQEIRLLGVTHYEAYVTDGRIDYFGSNGYHMHKPPAFEPQPISDTPRQAEFQAELSAHQQGKTDYRTFLNSCATLGVEKWVISMSSMTCTYYDKAGHEILTEAIPH